MMEIRNNNKEIIKLLAKEGYRSSRSRNRLMAGAVALTVIIIFTVFSIMSGRIDAEYLAEIRHEGSNAATFLENPTQEQIKKIKSLYYIKGAGAINMFAQGRVEGRTVFACVTAEAYTYKDILLPAYTELHGYYPKQENEIMLPVRALQEMLISDPELGMELEIEVYLDRGKSEVQTFTLCGYYTEYVHPAEGVPMGFFSEKYLNRLGFDMEHPTSLYIQQNDLFAGDSVEEMLYRDVETTDEVQRFDSKNSVNYNVIRGAIGGYDIAAICILLIVMCVFLLNYNIMNISLGRDVRHFGLLKTLGATDRQIRRIVYRQVLRISVTGIAAGALVSLVLILLLLPRVLSNYYMNNYGVASDMMTFSPLFLFISILLGILVSYVSVLGPVHKAGKITPIESMKYIRNQSSERSSKRQKQKSKNGSSIYHMAWRNIWRSRRSTLLTILSLFLGLSVALCSLLVVRGMDYTNNFKSFPDFTFESSYNPQWVENYDTAFMPVTPEDITFFQSISGVERIDIIYGDYIKLQSTDSVWQPYLKADSLLPEQQTGVDDAEYAAYVRESFFTRIVVADEAFLSELEAYVKEKNIPLDLESLKNGTGAISTSGNKFSEKLLASSQALIGERFEIKTSEGGFVADMTFCGFLDVSKEGCPYRHVTAALNGPELMVSEKAMERLALTKRAIVTEIYVKEQKEPLIKKKLKALYEEKKLMIPPSEQDLKLPYMDINSDDLKAAQDEIKAIQTVMYSISILLILLGLFNYFNSTAANLLSRRNEIALMESIGITRKQLRRLLVMEGVYFSSLVGGMLTSVGSGLLFLVFGLLRSRLAYVKFYFPYIGMGVILMLLFAMCIMIPLVMYRYITNESVIERLRLSEE